jgi:hypothetical protein
MADFGNAGTRTVHASEAGGTIDADAGEFIICTVDVRGATAAFSFDCTHRTLFTPDGPPLPRYQWTTVDGPGSQAAMGDVHVLVLRFSGGAIWYRYRMELFDANLAVKQVLKDVEYETSDPTDVCFEPIALRTK